MLKFTERNVVAIKYQPILRTPILSPRKLQDIDFINKF